MNSDQTITDTRSVEREVRSLGSSLSPDLTRALQRLYMNTRAVSAAIRHDPDVAISRFKTDPTVFGALRTYVGPLSLKANIARVRRLLARLERSPDPALTPKTPPRRSRSIPK